MGRSQEQEEVGLERERKLGCWVGEALGEKG